VSGTPNSSALASALGFFALTAVFIAAAWWWLGAPVELPSVPTAAAAEKLYCVSYAPFRGSQDPLVEGTRVEPWQIEEDIAFLATYTGCVRTYSVDDGAESVLASARRHGLKVMHGVWVSADPEKTRRQVETSIALAKAYPDVMIAMVIGNEVLLRGEMTANDLASIIRHIKAQVAVPVTYADVWEFWLRYPDLQNAVDFVTIHILPYWEDFPIPAERVAAHVAAIRAKVAAAMPGKDIVIGEFGWPSAGRMREGARPSPSNQARAVIETLALAQHDKFRLNVIEAFDQPWKRALEGAVGGYWGIFDRAAGGPKFPLAGGSVSDHPHWAAQALAGVIVAALAFAGAFLTGRKNKLSPMLWLRIAVLTLLPAILFGWTLEMAVIDSFGVASWLRSIAFAAVAAAAPIVCAAACGAGRPLPGFAALLHRAGERRDGLDWLLGGTLIALTLFAVEAALGLVFDPRYRDIPFAPLTAATIPFLMVVASMQRTGGVRRAAETLAGAVLAASAVYILFNETFANWQAVWFSAASLALAATLIFTRSSAPDAPSSG
jgi:exo-beta-1,3-glucanase (GH17 family)